MYLPGNIAWSVLRICRMVWWCTLLQDTYVISEATLIWGKKKFYTMSKCASLVDFPANKNGPKLWSKISLHYKLTLELLNVYYAMWEFSAPIFSSYDNLGVQIWNMDLSFYIYCSVHRNILWNNQQMRQCAVKFISLQVHSTCFGRHTCPSSGVQF